MAVRFGDAPHAPCRHASVVCWVSVARAEEASSPTSQEQQPSATPSPSPSPSGQKGGAGGVKDRLPPAAAANNLACQPDSTPGRRWRARRSLDFTATRLDPAVRRQGASPCRYLPITPTQLDGADRANRPVRSVSTRPGRVLGLGFSFRPIRPLARVRYQVRAYVSAARLIVAQRRDLARLHRSRLHRSVGTGQPASSRPATTCSSVSTQSTASQRHRARDPALLEKTIACCRRNSSPARAMAASAARDRAQPATTPAGRRRARVDHCLTPVRLSRICPAHVLNTCTRCRAGRR